MLLSGPDDDCAVVVVVGEFEPPHPVTASMATAMGTTAAKIRRER
jgi:hypothetical protein